ncbi:protein N-lysine methyltransferase METTL21D-like [Ornithodoros turicata]|uniref:protein N-lysine methyltransferase METTL21D-like n=1 Tax=Ornithodoros turicata TaxID=34597 RepID=UPI0031397A30
MSDETFTRDIYLDSTENSLTIHQWSVGDVGCVVWDGALALGKYIDRSNSVGQWKTNSKILELGAGTGAVGLIASCFGNDVLLTDLPELLPLIKMNVNENERILKGEVDVRSLQWGSCAENCKDKPDVLLMSECVYYEESIEPLVQTMTDLSGPRTQTLLSYEERDNEANARTLAKFLELTRKNFLIEEVPLEDQHPEFRSEDIHILKLSRKQS